MVRFDGEQLSLIGDKAVQGTVGFEVARGLECRRMRLEEGADIRDQRPAAIRETHLGDSRVLSGMTMRAAAARDQCIQFAIQKGHVGHAYQITLRVLRGWEFTGHRGANTLWTDLGHSRRISAGVGTDRPRNLSALLAGTDRTTGACLGNV